jgi:hypothetical protein
MAEVWLPRIKYERNRVLPPVCVMCGAPGEMRLPAHLTVSPRRVEQLKLPLCDAHNGHLQQWARLRSINVAFWLVSTALYFFLLFARQITWAPWLEDLLFGAFGWPVLSASCLVFHLLIAWSAPIKCRASGPHHFVLTGVSEQFAEAVKNDRDGNWLLWQVEQAGGKEMPTEEGITPRPDELPDSRIQPGPE